jgi:hypothetical protein
LKNIQFGLCAQRAARSYKELMVSNKSEEGWKKRKNIRKSEEEKGKGNL